MRTTTLVSLSRTRLFPLLFLFVHSSRVYDEINSFASIETLLSLEASASTGQERSQECDPHSLHCLRDETEAAPILTSPSAPPSSSSSPTPRHAPLNHPFIPYTRLQVSTLPTLPALKLEWSPSN